MKETKKIKITEVDLDHILDLDYIREERNTPPSEVFKEGLKREFQMNGIEVKEGEELELYIKIKMPTTRAPK